MANNKPSLRASSGKVFWKLAPVILAIGAYFGLGAIENAKNSYDKERAAPIVITDQTNRDKKSIFEIGIGDIQARLSPDSWTQLEPYIRNIKFRPFKNESELGDALNEEVLTEKAANERRYQYRREGLNMNYAAERLLLFNERGKIETTIEAELAEAIPNVRKKLNNLGDEKNLPTPCFNAAPTPQSKATKPAANQNWTPKMNDVCKQLEDWKAIMTRINELEAKYQKEQEYINNDLASLDQEAQGKIKRIYLDMKSAVLGVKSGTPNENIALQARTEQSGRDSLKSYNFQSVLDENHGIHVIYQVLRLIFIVLLVFGIISVGLALLRLFPSYASSSEALTDQAKTFLSRNSSAAPNIARAAVVSLAAIGIGTAVVVAGNSGSGQSSVALNTNASGPVTQNNERQEKKTDGPGGTDFGTRVVPMPYPVPYPSPVTVQAINNNTIPSPDEKVIRELTTSVDGLRTQVNGINEDISRNVKDPLTKLDMRVTDYDVPGLTSRTNTLSTNLGNLQGMADTLRTDFFTKLEAASNKLDTTNSTMIGIRSDSLTKLQRPEGRSFFTRVKQFFNPTERYFVSEQAYVVLENLLCTTSCRDSRGNFTGTNSMLLTYLYNLKNNPRQQPMTDKQLFDALGGADSTNVKPWKSIILRYTRIP